MRKINKKKVKLWYDPMDHNLVVKKNFVNHSIIHLFIKLSATRILKNPTLSVYLSVFLLSPVTEPTIFSICRFAEPFTRQLNHTCIYRNTAAIIFLLQHIKDN